MRACKTREPIDWDTDFISEHPEEFYAWRNHDNLNEWMIDLYNAKGGNNSDTTVVLDEDDLDELEVVLKAGTLPDSASRVSDAAMLSGDLDFVRLARKALAEGYTTFYYWW